MNCPICKELVKELHPERGGTVTDSSGRRWHKDCWDEECIKLEKIRKEAIKK